LHAQAIALPDDDPSAPRWPTRSLVLAAVLAATVAAAMLLMWLRPALRMGPVTPVSTVAAPAPSGPADAVLPPPTAVAQTSAAPAIRSSRRPPPELASSGPAAPGEAANDATADVPPPSAARTMPLPATAPPTAMPAGTPATTPVTTPSARSSALPPGAPRAVVSGGVFSQNAASRMVIVNGQVFGEGAEPVAGVTIEQIAPNRAVLRYQGQRYTVNY
jgi:general secretion pathway protein B